MPLKPLLPVLGFVYAGQALAAAVFVPLKTEKYYDLCGSLGFLSALAFSLRNTPVDVGSAKTAASSVVQGGSAGGGGLAGRILSSFGIRSASAVGLSSSTAASALAADHWTSRLILNRHPRQLIASALVAFWAARLGTFLFQRIQKSGKDSRFDEIKQSPPKFFGAWMMQATWISLTALPIFMLNALPARSLPALGLLDAGALLVWSAGWGLEVVADRTKSAWRAERDAGKHSEKFLTRGVWSWSRHPNYFGEVSLWTGQALLALPTLLKSRPTLLGPWAPYAALASPALEYGLIRYISGVPMLEEGMDKKLKDDPAYKKYKDEVPCFVPFIGSKD
ncbi:DUF1295-domain-containing protein [Acaromyces ingoldii]|uniref:DUF1295-domain-containing protein n=1 Tax=Acaromyces ingoldii TaxID=215250 RepID=A0A316YXM6_9BASI|nr:DUF1295-domain-containing protein [Acaromyces ingoldii]PWN93882.1 DUF1295-domain-containing protein [Acaromyces ingoldii]